MSAFYARLEFAPHRIIPGAFALAPYAAVCAGAHAPIPVRVGLAVLALSFWPGAMLLRFLLGGREIEWPGRLALSFALGLLVAQGIAWLAYLGHFDSGVALWLLPLFGLALACVRRMPPVEAPAARGALPWLIVALWIAVLAGVFGTLGAPLMSDTDSPDHIATVRRIMTTHVVFPTDAYFADAGRFGFDPRKGLYHAWVALVARAGHVDAVETWRWLPFFLIPMLALAFHELTAALTGSRTAALLAAFLMPFLYGGGPGGTQLRETVYSTRVGEIAALLAAAALVRFVEGGGRRRLALFWAVGTCAVFVHVWYALYFALAFGAYAAATLLARQKRVDATRLAAALVGLVAITAPYLAFRAAQAYAPQNAIHTEPQGLLYLTDRWFVVEPLALWSWHGAWLAIALLAAPWFWSRRHVSSGAIYCAVVPAAVLLVVLNPFVLPFVHAKLGYLTMRMIWVAPVIPAIATLTCAWGEIALRARGRRRVWGALGLVGLAVLLVPSLQQAVTVVTERTQLRAAEAERSAAQWKDLLDELDSWPGPRVFLSDPATNYSIPAYTGHYVSAYLDQHSSPNDPKGLERILDARDVLSPYVGIAHTLSILREYKVDFVVLNQRMDHATQYDYWALQPVLYGVMRDKFGSHPEYFRLAWQAPAMFVYALTPAARSGPLPPEDAPPRPLFVSAAGATARPALRDGAFLLYGTRVEPAVAAPGDTLAIETGWGVAGNARLAPGSYQVFVRLETHVPHGPFYVAAFDKLSRKLEERISGVKWRLRETHLPLGGILGADQWRPGEIVDDRSIFPIPSNAAPGRYTVRVRLIRSPHYVNLRLRDYFKDDDRFSGPVVGSVTIVPRARIPGAGS